MTQNRVYWAVETFGFAPLGATTGFTPVHGAQSVGITTAFNLQPAFELGESRVYQMLEDIPDVQITAEKILDGYCPMYLLATQGSPANTLFGRSTQKCQTAFSIFPDTNDSSSGTPTANVICSGMYVSASSFHFDTNGPAKENLSLVGNNKVWNTSASPFSAWSGAQNTDNPLGYLVSGSGVQRRQNFVFGNPGGASALDANSMVNATVANKTTILPPDVAGINASGLNDYDAANTRYACSVQSIAVSASLGRDSINELGHKAPYYRFLNLPVEVTTEIEILSKSGDWISATEAGVYGNGNNTRLSTIKIAMTDGLFIDLGVENRCNNVSVNGGDTGGGQQTITYSYVTYNYYTVTHPQDPTFPM